MRTIAIMNNKGGVGKTVTALSLGDILSHDFNRRVLLIDCDGQMNLSRLCLPDFAPDTVPTLSDLLTGQAESYWLDNIQSVTERMDILPASSDLYSLDAAAIFGRYNEPPFLQDFLRAIEADYALDFVLLDCPPGYTVSSVAALSVADEVIVPVSVDAFAVWGQRELTKQLQQLKGVAGRPQRVTLLLTQWRNADVVNQVGAMLREMETPVFKTAIRRTEKVPESTFYRLPVRKYSKTSAATKDYRALAEEILGGGV